MDPLDFFRPARVRGRTLQEKLISWRQTLNKVIEDSKEDTSKYRVQYAEVHRAVLEQISHEDPNLPQVFAQLVHNLNQASQVLFPGIYDASGRLAAELEDLLSLEA